MFIDGKRFAYASELHCDVGEFRSCLATVFWCCYLTKLGRIRNPQASQNLMAKNEFVVKIESCSHLAM